MGEIVKHPLNTLLLISGIYNHKNYAVFQGYYFAKPMPVREFEEYAFSKQ